VLRPFVAPHSSLVAEPSDLRPILHEWHTYRSIPYRAKRAALLLIALSFGVSIACFVPGWPAKLAMGIGGLVLAIWIARIPSRDAPRKA